MHSKMFLWAVPAVLTKAANLAASILQRKRTSLLEKEKGQERFRVHHSPNPPPSCQSLCFLFSMIFHHI